MPILAALRQLIKAPHYKSFIRCWSFHCWKQHSYTARQQNKYKWYCRLYNLLTGYLQQHPNHFVNSYLYSNHWVIIFKFSTNINKSTSPPIKVKLLHKAYWKSINSSLSNQSAIFQNQISSMITPENPDPITIINNAANILTDIIKYIHNHLAETPWNSNTSISLTIQLLIKQQQ